MPAFAEAELLSVRDIFKRLADEHDREVTALKGEIAQLRQEPSVHRASGFSDRSAWQSDAAVRDRSDRLQRDIHLDVRRGSTPEPPLVARTAAVSSGCHSPHRAVVIEDEPVRVECEPAASASSSQSFSAPPDEGLVFGTASGVVGDSPPPSRERTTSKRLPTLTRSSSYSTLASRSTWRARTTSKTGNKSQPEVNSKATLDPNDLGKSERSLSRNAEALEAQGAHLRAVCLKVVANHNFDSFLGFVIILNSILIGAESVLVPADKRDANVLHPNAETMPYLVAENIFLFIYVCELGLRFFAQRMEALASGWVKFDLVLVVIGISGSWLFPLLGLLMSSASGGELTSVPMVLRVFRLARLARALRLFAQFRTLWMLVHGLISSVSTICNVFLVLFLTLYVFSCISVEMITHNELADNPGEFQDLVQMYWRSLPICMLTLVQCVSFDSIGMIYSPMIQDDPRLLLFFVPFLLIVSVVLMNLVTAVIVEAFLEHAKQDNELRNKEREQRVRNMMPHLKEVFESLDKDDTGKLTLEDLMSAPKKEKEELASLLDSDCLLELWEMLDTNGDGQVDVDEFCNGILTLTLSDHKNIPIGLLRMLRQIAYVREDLEMIKGSLNPSQETRAKRLSALGLGARAHASGAASSDTANRRGTPQQTLEVPSFGHLSDASVVSEGD